MNNHWYHVQNLKSPNVPDQVLEAEGEGGVRVDDLTVIPVEMIAGWGYHLTPIRLVPIANGEGVLWDDDRIRQYVADYPHSWEKAGVLEAMQEIRDSYEQERKNKIFIPVELRGCLLSTVQRAKNFLVELINHVEENMPKPKRVLSYMAEEIEGWKVEVAEYDAVLAAIIGETDG